MDESIAMLFTNRATVIEAQRVVERLGLKIKIRFSDHAGARGAAEHRILRHARGSKISERLSRILAAISGWFMV